MFGTLKKTLEETFAAQAFAEVGENEVAMRMAGVEEHGRVSVQDSFAAVAFAEAGSHELAREMMGIRPKRLMPTRPVCGFLESVGIVGVRVAYGLAEA